MCGIAGQLSFEAAPSTEAVRCMADALAHRGPDGEGFYASGPISLGHRRLSIIDLDTGEQPQFNEDGSLAIVFNGEIYNYKELMAELRPRHAFKTASDTEVLLHLYEELGEGMLERLRGMFAFALWDARKQRLFAARDRFGEKPFLYRYAAGPKGGTLTFASELRALRLGTKGASETVDRGALSDYLELLYIPAPGTIFSEVRKLPAAHYLLADASGLTIKRHWAPPVPGSEKAAAPGRVDRLRDALREAVRLRLRSDVPIAALLSGGLDSSAVVALMAEELGPGVKTFSLGFGAPDDELPHARRVAERFRTDHHEILVTSSLAEQVVEGFGAYSEPFGDSSSVPTVAVCKEVARSVKVVLTGDGGDELFAGYGTYRRLTRIPHVPSVDKLGPGLKWLPDTRYRRQLQRAARVAGAKGAARHRALIEVFSPDERAQLLGGARRAAPGADVGDVSDLDAALAFDLGVYLPDDLLLKTDVASMRWGLESRCPLLDEAVAAIAVPPRVEDKQTAQDGKLLLREAVGELLPEEILKRPKRGFGSPVELWLSGPLRGMVEELVRPRSARIRAWLDGGAIDRVIGEALAGKGNAHQAWALLALESWARG